MTSAGPGRRTDLLPSAGRLPGTAAGHVNVTPPSAAGAGSALEHGEPRTPSGTNPSPAMTRPAWPGGAPVQHDGEQVTLAPGADPTHLQGRFAVPAGPRQDGAEHDHWGGAPVPVADRTINRAMAAQYVRHLRAGDPGAAFALLHRLRHQENADPWRLLEAAVAEALSLRPSPAGRPAHPRKAES